MTENYIGSLKNEGREPGSGSQRPGPCLFRDTEIEKIFSVLKRSRSVLLLGHQGSGKTSIVAALAKTSQRNINRKIVELSTIQIMSGTKYTGEWETKTTQIINEAKNSRSILYLKDIWNLAYAGKSSNSNKNMLDAFRPHLENGELLAIGEVTPDLFFIMQQLPGFVHLFEVVPIEPLSQENINHILLSESKRMNVALDTVVSQRVLALCSRFLPVSYGPGPALSLLQQCRDYMYEKRNIGEAEAFSAAFVEKVFSIYTGLPLFIVSPSVTKPVREIRDWFRQRVIGQEDAIDAVVEVIVLYKAALQDPNKPIGSFLFVGPTGVGKTELARALAQFLFGGTNRLLRFDMSEYKDYHAFQMLIGNPDSPQQGAKLIDPVRAHPFQVILLDELEKAHGNIFDLMLQLLDDGRLTPPRGPVVDFKSTIVIATSNAGAVYQDPPKIGFSPDAGTENDADRVRRKLEQEFKPEFLNRFQHVIVFHRLTPEQAAIIAKLELNRILQREGIKTRNIVVDVDEEVYSAIVEHSFDQRFGARAVKRDIQRLVVVPIANLFMERFVEPGSLLKIKLVQNQIKVRVIETEESRNNRQEKLPVKTGDGETYTSEEIATELSRIKNEISQMAETLNKKDLQRKLNDFDLQRSSPDFWRHPDKAYPILLQSDQLSTVLKRLDSLEEQAEGLETDLNTAKSRAELQVVMNHLARTRRNLQKDRLELVALGQENNADALVEFKSIGPDRPKGFEHLFRLYDIYIKWARYNKYEIEMLCEPFNFEDSLIFGVKGDYGFGYLKLESGHHRFREEDINSIINVRVIPWPGSTGPVKLNRHQALKKKGLLNGAIRSRLEFEGCSLVLQNEKSLVENQNLAESIVPDWINGPHTTDEVIRRYDSKPFVVRDYLTDIKSGRAELLKPEPFHQLLAERIDIMYRRKRDGTEES